jgi:hypothetical protein
MIDHELSRLAGALRAAEDTLNSPDFGAKQARLVALEQEVQDTLARLDAERETLAAALENDEAAYEDAQNALTAYIAANYLESVGTNEPDDDDLLEPIRAAEPEYTGNMTRYFQEMADSKLHGPTLDDTDEFSTPRANGALSDA